jgi:hypothetical protein
VRVEFGALCIKCVSALLCLIYRPCKPFRPEQSRLLFSPTTQQLSKNIDAETMKTFIQMSKVDGSASTSISSVCSDNLTAGESALASHVNSG